MRLVYFGTPADAVPPLRALLDAGHDIALVVTQPDRRRGARGNELEPSAVKRAALASDLEVATPAKAREVVDTVRALDADLGVVVAFGQLLPPALLGATRHGFVNVHFSLLPRWRGAAPVERAILAGDSETGVAIMAVEEGLDTGGIFAEARVGIGDDTTAGELRNELVAVGTDLLVHELASIPGRTPRAQVGEATYAAKLDPDDFRIDPTRAPTELVRIVRAGNPKPGAWCTLDGRRLKVWRAAVAPSAADGASAPEHATGTIDSRGVLQCADGGLRFVDVQPEGKRSMPATSWLAGRRGETRIDT
jgi:methionyl-tRNA formyltransferase